MINYIEGDLFESDLKNKVIAHIVNDAGGWGAGFVLPLAKNFPVAEQEYRKLVELSAYYDQFIKYGLIPFALDQVQYVRSDKTIIANMVAQEGCGREKKRKVRYGSLAKCLYNLNHFCNKYHYDAVMPLIGCGLGGGNWTVISALIEDIMETDVTVFHFEKDRKIVESA